MKRSFLNLTLDVLLLLTGLGVAATGLLMAYVLPPRSGGVRVWGWTRHDFGDLHLYLALGLLGLAVIHVLLHWKWICGVVLRMLRRDTAATTSLGRHLAGALTLAVILVLLGGFLWLANAAKVQGGPGQGEHRGWGTSRTANDAARLGQKPIDDDAARTQEANADAVAASLPQES